MATYLELNLNQWNDEDVQLTLTQAGAALDLATASALEFYLKPHRTTADADLAVTKLTVGSGIAITDASAGTCIASIPASALAAAGLKWWRIDAIITGKRKTALFGLVHVADT